MTARALAVTAVLAAGCGPAWKQLPHERQYQVAAPPRLHRLSSTATLSDWWDKTLHSTIVPLAKTISPARYLDRLTGGRPALDLNVFGEVPDSAWFTNRIGRGVMKPDDVAAGPGGAGGPPQGKLTVISGKLEGATPGAVVRDAGGVIWFVKFDPPGYPQLSTGAEVIASRILHAAGYWVPEMYVAGVSVDRFVLGPDAYRRDRYNRRVAMTAADLINLLSNLNPDPQGRLVGLFSRSVPGRPIGPADYRGVRTDDPNDRIPHERRRSLRGLWLVSAWINNTDTRRQNTLDTFVSDGASDGGYLRHYLIDFGDSLGAAGERPKYLGEGYEGQVNWAAMGKRWIGLGLSYPYWFAIRRSTGRTVGVLEADVFDPARWEPNFPNPAFDEAGVDDTFWAASIIARFTRPHIAAAVGTAHYTDPKVTEQVVDLLVARRDKVLRFAFADRLPLADPVIEDGYRVVMSDLEVIAGIRPGGSYRWSVRWNRTGRGDRVLASGSGDLPAADLRGAIQKVMTSDHDDFVDDPFVTLRFRRKGHRAAVDVNLRVVRDYLLPVGIVR